MCRTVIQQLDVGSSAVILAGGWKWSTASVFLQPHQCFTRVNEDTNPEVEKKTKNSIYFPFKIVSQAPKLFHKSNDFLFLLIKAEKGPRLRVEILMLSCFDSCVVPFI